ncbi:hypothetical protein EV696_12612 [Permianibacter aggregans]|uniref:Uncharacterized protein n=1 Tax=Permianibacter aggregans TaxID=1510150 RepID=A0A4R6UBT8_9GAMM|nr:hypothetical protein EV696_12612 [Permianibacter aggregans]
MYVQSTKAKVKDLIRPESDARTESWGGRWVAPIYQLA